MDEAQSRSPTIDVALTRTVQGGPSTMNDGGPALGETAVQCPGLDHERAEDPESISSRSPFPALGRRSTKGPAEGNAWLLKPQASDTVPFSPDKRHRILGVPVERLT